MSAKVDKDKDKNVNYTSSCPSAINLIPKLKKLMFIEGKCPRQN